MMDTSKLLGDTGSKVKAGTGWDVEGNENAPDWMPGGYAKWWSGSDPEYDPSDPTPKQKWWRSGSLPGGLVWHPYWGWQERSAVKDLYAADTDNSVTWDEFQDWGLTKQQGTDWSVYYPSYGVDSGDSGVGGGGNSGDSGDSGTGGGSSDWSWDWSGLLSGIGGTTPTTGGSTMADTSYDWGAFTNYPSQWGQSQEILNYLGQSTPWQYDQASQTASDMAYSGMPTDVDPWYRAAQQQGWYDTQDAIKQAAETAGLGGTRWSTQMGRSAQDIAGRKAADLATSYAQQTMSAQEAARARQLQGSQQLAGLGTDVNNQLFGVSDRLSSLGSQYGQYPIDVANAAYGMGQGNVETTQSALDKYYQEFLRTSAENNPYLAMIYQMATGQGMPQQYSAGMLTQLLGLIGNIF